MSEYRRRRIILERTPLVIEKKTADMERAGSGLGTRLSKALSHIGFCSRRDAEKLIKEGRVKVNGAVVITMGSKVKDSDRIEVDNENRGSAGGTSFAKDLNTTGSGIGKGSENGDDTFSTVRQFRTDILSPMRAARLWLYHKPPGVLVTHKDPQNRTTVFELFKSSSCGGKSSSSSSQSPLQSPCYAPSSHIVSIGRLDINSEGLLLLTDNKALAHSLEKPTVMPSSNSTSSSGRLMNLERVYNVRAFGKIDPSFVETVAKGVSVKGIRYKPVKVSISPTFHMGYKYNISNVGNRNADGAAAMNNWFKVTLNEGKNREIRKIFENFGLSVNKLVRVQYGPFSLGKIKVGDFVEQDPTIVRKLVSDILKIKSNESENDNKSDPPST